VTVPSGRGSTATECLTETGIARDHLVYLDLEHLSANRRRLLSPAPSWLDRLVNARRGRYKFRYDGPPPPSGGTQVIAP
jgi:hypothetical protein